jgi:hypothetical protein
MIEQEEWRVLGSGRNSIVQPSTYIEWVSTCFGLDVHMYLPFASVETEGQKHPWANFTELSSDSVTSGDCIIYTGREAPNAR